MTQEELRRAVKMILDPKLSIHMGDGLIGTEYRVKKIVDFINENFMPKEKYPHAFGCEKFDGGKCNCGYESYNGQLTKYE